MKLLVCFHSLVFFTINVVYAIYTYQTKLFAGGQKDINVEVTKRLRIYLIFIVVVMAINIWEILRYWIDSRSKEFYIRKVCGATKNDIQKRFLMDYIKIIMVSIIIGGALCYAFSFMPMEYSKNVCRWFGGIKIILISSYVVPVLIGIGILRRQQNNDIFKKFDSIN
ncbi:MAG: FtsX-like permease family protein [Anaerostipes sp.]|jgi:ABC-type lipoprotein release transport system permease subunit